MSAFTGTPVTAATAAIRLTGPRALPTLRIEPFYWLHTSTQGSGTGLVYLCVLPPGRWRLRPDYSSLSITALATGADLALGLLTYQDATRATVASDADALVTATAGFAALSTADGSNKDLTFTAVTRGTDGETITITIVDPGAEGALGVAAVGTDITITLANSAVPAITSTAAEVKAACNADADVAALVGTELKSGQDGTGVMTDLGQTALSPGALPATTLADLGIATQQVVDSLAGVTVYATIANGNIEAGDIIQGWIAYEPAPPVGA